MKGAYVTRVKYLDENIYCELLRCYIYSVYLLEKCVSLGLINLACNAMNHDSV